MDGDNEIEIDARTSDAIAIAIRMGCPIFTYNDILQEAGIVLADNYTSTFTSDDTEEDLKKDIFETLSKDELEKQMKEAIDEEDYERASKIRDEINRRKH